MKVSIKLFIHTVLLSVFVLVTCAPRKAIEDSRISTYEWAPENGDLKFYWKNKSGQPFKNFKEVEQFNKKQGKKLVFAMNGGMFHANYSPVGLYIENGQEQSPLDTATAGYGNFYMQPNGVFYLTENNMPKVVKTASFNYSDDIKYATQSGPMLMTNSKINPKFNKGSENVNIRNGVGVLPNGNVLFAISTERVNFYDFAKFFKNKGCVNALYLDGYVSKMYCPEKNSNELGGKFGVIMGVSI